MYDVQRIITDILGLLHLTDISHFLIPQIGVGGGVEAKEHVELMPLIKSTLIFLAVIGAVFGVGLALAARKFSVKIDPKVEQVKDVLAHAHCGACGYAGCEQYAEAVVCKPDVPPNLCIPGGKRTCEAVALITGKKAEAKEPALTRLMGTGGGGGAGKKKKKEGV